MSQAVASLINRISDQLLNPFIWLLTVVALVVFLWNLVILLSTTDGDKISGAKGKIVWSLVGLAIMVSAIGIMNIVIDTWTALK